MDTICSNTLLVEIYDCLLCADPRLTSAGYRPCLVLAALSRCTRQAWIIYQLYYLQPRLLLTRARTPLIDVLQQTCRRLLSTNEEALALIIWRALWYELTTTTTTTTTSSSLTSSRHMLARSIRFYPPTTKRFALAIDDDIERTRALVHATTVTLDERYVLTRRLYELRALFLHNVWSDRIECWLQSAPVRAYEHAGWLYMLTRSPCTDWRIAESSIALPAMRWQIQHNMLAATPAGLRPLHRLVISVRYAPHLLRKPARLVDEQCCEVSCAATVSMPRLVTLVSDECASEPPMELVECAQLNVDAWLMRARKLVACKLPDSYVTALLRYGSLYQRLRFAMYLVGGAHLAEHALSSLVGLAPHKLKRVCPF